MGISKYGVRSRWLVMCFYLGLGAVLASLYIWLLPVLAEAQVIPLRREYGPLKQSISDYIATAPGTGLMAAVFLQPLMLMGSDEAARLNIHTASPGTKRAYYGSLTCFKIGFGLFLWLTVSEYGPLHFAAVALFSAGGACHALVTLRAGRLPFIETGILVVGAIAGVGIVGCVLAAAGGGDLPDYSVLGARVPGAHDDGIILTGPHPLGPELSPRGPARPLPQEVPRRLRHGRGREPRRQDRHG
jgi:hypothetical protein